MNRSFIASKNMHARELPVLHAQTTNRSTKEGGDNLCKKVGGLGLGDHDLRVNPRQPRTKKKEPWLTRSCYMRIDFGSCCVHAAVRYLLYRLIKFFSPEPVNKSLGDATCVKHV